MAQNFKILSHRNSDNLHLKLMGDFDGSSAFQLLNTLKKNIDVDGKIFIHTNSLTSVHPFGSKVFHNNVAELRGGSKKIIFTGDYVEDIAN